MKWQQLILVFIASICLIFAGNALAQTDINQCLFSNGNLSLQQQFLIGLAILTVLTLIPFFGGLVVFLANLFGLGVILLWQFGREKPQVTT